MEKISTDSITSNDFLHYLEKNDEEILQNAKLIVEFVKGMQYKKMQYESNYDSAFPNLKYLYQVDKDKLSKPITKEINEKINNFMFANTNISYIIDLRELKFHSCFNSIMQVLCKIESLGYKWEIGSSKEYPYHYCKINNICNIEGISPLDSVYGAVIEFINFYNELNQK